MTKEVLISLRGVQFDGPMDENAEPLEIITNGEYYFRNDTHYILYNEMADNNPSATKCRIKIKGKEVELVKRGASNVVMNFVEKQKNLSSYGMLFGSVMIGIDTTKIAIYQSEDRMRVQITYRMDVNYEFLAVCNIAIDVCSKEKGSVLFRS